jgi:glucose dehydrogenase
MTQGETQMQRQEADGWSRTIFISPTGEGKIMVVDRPKGHIQFRVQTEPKGRQEEQAGGKVAQSQAGVKSGRTINKRIAKGVQEKHTG